MDDPIGSFNTIKGNFILYIKTRFFSRFPSVEEERKKLLMSNDNVYKEPWVEVVQKYKSSGKTPNDLVIDDLPGMDEKLINDFKEITLCGLLGNFELYDHQIELLKSSLNGNNCIITTGTGSGKTEAFLLPIFAMLIKESKNWTRPKPPHPNYKNWWSNKKWIEECNNNQNKVSIRVPQREHENRDAALRALIIYPMNALVEDQLTRLRKALDSDNIKSLLEKTRNGNLFYFGRYNSSTPVPGHEYKYTSSGKRTPNKKKIEHLQKILRENEKQYHEALKASKKLHTFQSSDYDKIRYFWPSLNGAEMRSRWDMQEQPPDILVTNFSMLNVMMMREEDEQIFKKQESGLKKIKIISSI